MLMNTYAIMSPLDLAAHPVRQAMNCVHSVTPLLASAILASASVIFAAAGVARRAARIRAAARRGGYRLIQT